MECFRFNITLYDHNSIIITRNAYLSPTNYKFIIHSQIDSAKQTEIREHK